MTSASPASSIAMRGCTSFASAAATRESWTGGSPQKGFGTSGVIPLQRDVETPEGMRTAHFDCVHFAASETPEGLVQAAHHRTPQFIHQSRYVAHPNRVVALSEVILCVDDPDAYELRYGQLTGVRGERVGVKRVFRLPLVAQVSIVAADDIGRVLPDAAPPTLPYIAGCSMATQDLVGMATRLRDHGIPFTQSEGRVIVPAEVAFGAAIVFEAVGAQTPS